MSWRIEYKEPILEPRRDTVIEVSLTSYLHIILLSVFRNIIFIFLHLFQFSNIHFFFIHGYILWFLLLLLECILKSNIIFQYLYFSVTIFKFQYYYFSCKNISKFSFYIYLDNETYMSMNVEYFINLLASFT